MYERSTPHLGSLTHPRRGPNHVIGCRNRRSRPRERLWLSARTGIRNVVLQPGGGPYSTLWRNGRFPMKYSLRKTPSHLHLTYKYGEANGGLLGRNLVLEADGNVLTLEVDLSANLLARNKSSPWYLDAVSLSTNYHKLKSLQCPDNLVRTRLIRAW